jgi:catechol 2,3-dioxygenase-like lactoylglutathione lyase family enzyme
MIPQLEELIEQYERGNLARREFLGALVGLTYGVVRPSATRAHALLPARNLTHVNIRVRDVKESERFYRELFGLPPVHDVVGAAYALDLPGGGFISLCPLNNPDCGLKDPPTPGDIDHFGLGVANFQAKTTARQLNERGLETYDAGSSVFIKDPNGTWIQISAPKESFRK